MKGFVTVTTSLPSIPYEQLRQAIRDREGIEGYYPPTIGDFFEFAVDNCLDEYLKLFPISHHDSLALTERQRWNRCEE